MPIDPILINSILDEYRDKLNECKEAKLDCCEFGRMSKLLKRMEELAETHHFFQEYIDELIDEGLMTTFSETYNQYCKQKMGINNSIKPTPAAIGKRENNYELRKVK